MAGVVIKDVFTHLLRVDVLKNSINTLSKNIIAVRHSCKNTVLCYYERAKFMALAIFNEFCGFNEHTDCIVKLSIKLFISNTMFAKTCYNKLSFYFRCLHRETQELLTSKSQYLIKIANSLL